MAKAPDICPGCSKPFIEQEWPFPGAQAEWVLADGLKFHGHGCLKSYNDKIARLEAVLEKNVRAL